MTILAQTALPEALETVSRECDYLIAEVAAFELFADRVRSLQIDQRVPDGGSAIITTPRDLVVPTDDASFRAVRRAYQETVLSVDHWQDAYGESTVPESFAGEFSPAVASLLARPESSDFTPALRNQLVRECEVVIRVRSRTLSHLNAEARELRRISDALDPIVGQIASIEQTVGTFDERADSIRTTERSLQALLRSHQAYIHSCPSRVYRALRSSVYEEMTTTYPGLSTLAVVLSRLERAEHRLWAGL